MSRFVLAFVLFLALSLTRLQISNLTLPLATEIIGHYNCFLSSADVDRAPCSALAEDFEASVTAFNALRASEGKAAKKGKKRPSSDLGSVRKSKRFNPNGTESAAGPSFNPASFSASGRFPLPLVLDLH